MAETVNTPCYSAALSFLKADLGFFSAEIPADLEKYLSGLLATARTELSRSRIVLDPNDTSDAQLQAMYAAWLYRKRTDGPAKPPMLQFAIRNRQVSQALDSAAYEEGFDDDLR